MMRKILTNKSGETLLEAMLSIMIFALIILTVMTMTVTSINITNKSKQRSDDYYKQLSQFITGETVSSDEYDLRISYNFKIAKEDGTDSYNGNEEIKSKIKITDKGIVDIVG